MVKNPKYHFLHLKNPFDTFTGWVPGGLGYDLPERFKIEKKLEF